MKLPIQETLTPPPARPKKWLAGGPVLLASVVLHGLALAVISMLGAYGFLGDGISGTGGTGGDSFSVTWIPSGGSRGGRVIDTSLPNSNGDGELDNGPTMEVQPVPQKGPAIPVATTEPQDVFNSNSDEPLTVDDNDHSTVQPRTKPKNRDPAPTNPEESEMTGPPRDRKVATASARSTVEMDAESGDGNGIGMGGEKGNGQGSGQGAGNGVPGKGKGGVNFFGIFAKAKRVVYLIDASESMRQHNAMELAREKLWNSLQELSPEAEFQVVFFNLANHAISRPGEKPKLLLANSKNLRLAHQMITGIQPDSGTDRMAAITFGLSFDPDALYLLTDVDAPELTVKQLFQIQRGNKRKTQIHVVEFGLGADLSGDTFLKKLARENYGKHIYHDLAKQER